jgi:hypothetical protein
MTIGSRGRAEAPKLTTVHPDKLAAVATRTSVTLDERSSLILDVARVLYVNGQTTDQTLAAIEQLGNILELRVSLANVRWGELQLQIDDGDAKLIAEVIADPSGVDMDRVALQPSRFAVQER